MPERTPEAEAFFHGVYSAIQEIPWGKVTTYGHIAKLVGFPERPRQVGVCLKHLPHNQALEHNSDNVPWQRVINAKEEISPRGQPSAAANQARELRAEGVDVGEDAMGTYHINMMEYGWFPERLPSETEGGGEQGEQKEGGDGGGEAETRSTSTG